MKGFPGRKWRHLKKQNGEREKKNDQRIKRGGGRQAEVQKNVERKKGKIHLLCAKTILTTRPHTRSRLSMFNVSTL